MSYLALARKYRPRRFEDVMGQSHVVRALSHALDTDRLHPAILLTGTRGVGKTTLARIIAKSLNCETGVSASPCGVCAACSEVDAGRFVDLMEIDAASNNGVDDVRQLIDNAHYPPVRGRYKVYLIDEVHMLSKPAFNALLKTLEEPPPYLKFILATTDPQKLLVTVLSRCLQFNLKRLPLTVIRDQLARVLADEGHAAAPDAVLELARAADGSMRDGLSLLDQALAFAGGQPLAREPVEEMLGVAGRRSVFDLLQALADGNGAALAALFQQLEMQAPDYAALLDALAAALQRIAVLQVLPSAQSEDDEAALLVLKERFTPEDVQLNYQIAVHGRRDLPWAPDPRVGFEMTVLRMHAFRPDAEDAGSRTGAGRSAKGAEHADTAERSGRAHVAESVKSFPARPDAAVVPSPAESDRPQRGGKALPQDSVQWAQCVESLRLDGMDRQLARQCAWVGVDGGVLRLSLESRARSLLTEPRRQMLEAALFEFFAQALSLRIDVEADAAAVDSPARQALAAEQRRIEQAHASISADPVVRAFQDHFGAQIRPGSIQPLDS